MPLRASVQDRRVDITLLNKVLDMLYGLLDEDDKILPQQASMVAGE